MPDGGMSDGGMSETVCKPFRENNGAQTFVGKVSVTLSQLDFKRVWFGGEHNNQFNVVSE